MSQNNTTDEMNTTKSRLLFVLIIGAVLLVVGGSIAAGIVLFNSGEQPAMTKTTAAPGEDIHSVYDGAVWDERIDSSDVGAEEAIRYFITTLIMEEEQPDAPDVNLDIYVTGNTVLYIYRCYAELSDGERQALADRAGELKTGSRKKLAELRERSKVKNLQIAYIFEDTDSVIAAVVCDE